jgi:hypothetical protein
MTVLEFQGYPAVPPQLRAKSIMVIADANAINPTISRRSSIASIVDPSIGDLWLFGMWLKNTIVATTAPNGKLMKKPM